MNKEFHFEEESVDMPVGIDPFKLRGRAFAITNKHGEMVILHIGDEYWITDLESGRDGCNTFVLQQTNSLDKDPWEWSPMLSVHLTHSRGMIDYAEEHCWGNLNADEQRMMAECPVVERYAPGDGTTFRCPRCRSD